MISRFGREMYDNERTARQASEALQEDVHASRPAPYLVSREQVAAWHAEALDRLGVHTEITAAAVSPGYWALHTPGGQDLGEARSHTLAELHARGVRLRRPNGEQLDEFDWTAKCRWADED